MATLLATTRRRPWSHRFQRKRSITMKWRIIIFYKFLKRILFTWNIVNSSKTYNKLYFSLLLCYLRRLNSVTFKLYHWLLRRRAVYCRHGYSHQTTFWEPISFRIQFLSTNHCVVLTWRSRFGRRHFGLHERLNAWFTFPTKIQVKMAKEQRLWMLKAYGRFRTTGYGIVFIFWKFLIQNTVPDCHGRKRLTYYNCLL